jgi:hypothetical protein
MSYIKSSALKQFEESNLLLLDKCRNCKNVTIDYSLKTLVFQGSMLLTCSALENYLKSLIDGWVYKLKTQSSTMGGLPEITRKVLYVRHRNQTFKDFAFTGDEQKAVSKIIFSDFAFALSNESAILPQYFSGRFIYANKKYPSIENIKKLFGTLGVPDVFRVMQIRYKKDYKLPLESFLGVRESLAHEFPPDVSYDDVKRQIISISIVARRIDEVAYAHLANASGVNYWPS